MVLTTPFKYVANMRSQDKVHVYTASPGRVLLSGSCDLDLGLPPPPPVSPCNLNLKVLGKSNSYLP